MSIRFRTLIALALAAALVALPAAAFAHKKKKGRRAQAATSAATMDGRHGIGPGGVPALRDRIYAQLELLNGAIGQLQSEVSELQATVDALEADATDDDGDGFSENQGDCNDDPLEGGADIFPGAEDFGGELADGIDNDCDGLVDEDMLPEPEPPMEETGAETGV